MNTKKFRAWNSERKVMAYFDLSELYKRAEKTGDYDFPKGWEVMQFINKYDANGKEIFEMDIIEVGGERIIVGEFGHQPFCKTEKYSRDLVYPVEKSVVIGNLCENPELIKT